jgi:predicted DNA-binding transcriptional regulator AlpA
VAFIDMKLSTLSVVLGLGMGLPQIYGLVKPAAFGSAVRKFPRSMLLGTAWFLWNLSQESISDFASYKNVLFAGFAAIGIGTCLFVQDFLAVRGLAVVFLLLARVMVDAGRPSLGETSWVLVIQSWAYLMVLGGIWFTVSPWRLRDLLEWGTANEKRIKVGCGLRLAFGLLVAGLGLTKF